MGDFLVAALLGVVEGATEFLPVSSTGHLIVVGALLGVEGPKAATFAIAIQLGAILAVAVVYRRRIVGLLSPRQSDGFSGPAAWGRLAVTTLPALVLGAIVHGTVLDRLFTPDAVAIGLVFGSVGLLVAERRPRPAAPPDLGTVTMRDAAVIGLVQCLALWPGVSRSAATIVGGMLVGRGRATAVEYSFLAAVPVIGAAAAFALVRGWSDLTAADLPVFAAGFLAAFGSAWVAVTVLLRLVQTSTLRPFAWYRLGLAAVILAFM